MGTTVNIKEEFRRCQINSEAFRFNEMHSKKDLINFPFLTNADLLPNIKNYTSIHYDHLAEAKNMTPENMFEAYWNNLSEKYNDSSAVSETDKNFIKDRLEKVFLPEYFKSTQVLFTHFFEQEYSLRLFQKHPNEIVHIVSSFYTGNTKELKAIIRKGIIGTKQFNKYFEVTSQQFCKDAYELALSVWDAHMTLLNFIELPRRANEASASKKLPFKKVDKYNIIIGRNRKDNRGKHKKDEKIIPQADFWQEAHRLYSEHGDKCLSSEDPKYPSEWMKKKLTGETSETEFFGYENKDKDKENPIKIKKGKIRELLGNNNRKWKLKE